MCMRRGKVSTEIVPCHDQRCSIARRRSGEEIEKRRAEREKITDRVRVLEMSPMDRSPEAAFENYRALRQSADKEQMLATNSTKADTDAYNTSLALERDVESMEGEVLKCKRLSFEYYRAVRIHSEAKERRYNFETQPAKKSRPAKKTGESRR